MPDRLALIKGPPAGRRSHLDGLCSALWPARAEHRRRYSRALAQRNALLGRIRAGLASEDSLDAWDAELADAGIELTTDRERAVDLLAPGFRRRDRVARPRRRGDDRLPAAQRRGRRGEPWWRSSPSAASPT